VRNQWNSKRPILLQFLTLPNRNNMPFPFIDKFARDDSVVKSIFDHVRNIGIAAVVLAAAGWKQKAAGAGFGGAVDHFIGILLTIVAMILFWVNHENMIYKLRAGSGTKWIKVAFIALYSIVFAEFVRFLLEGKPIG
jgi:hypothetical protein